MFRHAKSDDIIPGQQFVRLTVVQRVSRHYWLCRCRCGKQTSVYAYNLLTKKSKSCGCLTADMTRSRATIHGLTETPEYTTWLAMRRRCQRPKDPNYARYGGRGLTICKRWDRFEHFIADMGQRPTPQHSIERINNDGNYTPRNCRWATRAEQSMNKSNNLTFDYRGERWTTKRAAEFTGLCLRAIRKRIKLGWAPERILTEPKREW